MPEKIAGVAVDASKENAAGVAPKACAAELDGVVMDATGSLASEAKATFVLPTSKVMTTRVMVMATRVMATRVMAMVATTMVMNFWSCL